MMKQQHEAGSSNSNHYLSEQSIISHPSDIIIPSRAQQRAQRVVRCAVKAGTWSLWGLSQRGSVTRGTAVSWSQREKSWRLQSQRKGLLWSSTPFRPRGNTGSPPSLERELSSSFSHSRDSKPAKASSLEHQLSKLFTRSLWVMSHFKNRNVLLWNLRAKCSHSFLFLSWTKPALVKTGRKRICLSTWVITENPQQCQPTFLTGKNLKVATKKNVKIQKPGNLYYNSFRGCD